jgi:hypothetical protein
MNKSQIQDRVFHSDQTFGAYHDCERWLTELGCSIGTMQRGSPTAVMFSDNYDISKHRGLSASEIVETHGWIYGHEGRFREGPITFKVSSAGREYLRDLALAAEDETTAI